MAHMKALLFLFFLVTTRSEPSPTVYLCGSKNAARYHYSATCRGLSKCQGKIVKMRLVEARKQKKTFCKWEEKVSR